MASFAADTTTTLVTVVGPLAGVLLGGTFAYYTQTRLEERRERREREAEEASDELHRRGRLIRAHANAWSVAAEVNRGASLARRWLDGEITLQKLATAVVPMTSWQENRTLFADVLEGSEWVALVRAVEEFAAELDVFLAIAARHEGEVGLYEGKKLIEDLRSSGETLISKSDRVESALQPLFALVPTGARLSS